jgi:catechol 2,3-dioxygenase-like lactoylglutathione lyase family enzyme
MITALDHITLMVDDVDVAVETYERLGFAVTNQSDSGEHARAFVGFGDFYLEFVEPRRVLGEPASRMPALVLTSTDVDEDVTRLKSAGLAVSEISGGSLDGAGGKLAQRTAEVEFLTPLSLVEHHSNRQERDSYVGAQAVHPNSATTLERTYVAVESIERDLPQFEAMLGSQAPEPEMGTVIMSLMSVFYLGDIGIAVAEPRGPGPTAVSLSSVGPGVFQILFRAGSLDAAQRVMLANGARTPELGTRLSGESAALVLPSNACGIYVGFAGPNANP